jgi:hypothetical protein
MSYNAWLYIGSNPINYTDPSGLGPTNVPCESIMLPYMRNLCKTANMDDEDPHEGTAVLDARWKFFREIVSMSYLWSVVGGEGYRNAGKMLSNFLQGASYVRVDLPWGTSFDDDPGIMRATWKSVDAEFPDDEPMSITPLLYKFLKEHVEPNIGCEAYQVLPSVHIRGSETFTGKHEPRPHAMGWWGAFGHVTA